MTVAFAVLVVFLLLVGSELWWRRRVTHGEFSRKFVHITVGSFVAVWPFFLSWGEIQLLSVAFLVGVLISKYLNLFQAIHSVQRPTWGELFFAAAVGIITLLTHDQYVYLAALLLMSLADGLAAVLGVRFGNRFRYMVFGHPKSVVGTLTFWVVSLLILVGVNPYFSDPLSFAQLVGISAMVSIIENIGIKGSDNLLVPVVVTLFLLNV